MMHSRNRAAQYGVVQSHGLVADASPTRLVQIMFEHILSQLATAQGCMERIRNNVPLSEVKAKLAATLPSDLGVALYLRSCIDPPSPVGIDIGC